jgi:protein-S-isoprenylcysteine O-methyltransferase Ste14
LRPTLIAARCKKVHFPLYLHCCPIQNVIREDTAFKRWWTKIVSPAIERSTFVLLASLALILLFWQWRPIPAVVWQVTHPQMSAGLVALSLSGWALVFASTFMINHDK